MSSLVAVRPPGSLLVREVDDTVPVVLGGRPYPAVAVLAETLRSALASVTASEGEPPEQVVLTCPAVWGPARRQQFGEVSRRAGLTSVTVVSEPEAAVTGLVDGRRLVEDDVVLVYDIGGVTVDMTIVRVTDSGMEILGLPEGADGAGGADFDDLILAHVDHQLGGALSELDLSDPVAVGVLTGVRAECVRAKETLSRAETATVRVIGLAEVVGLNEELAPIVLARADFEAMIRKPLTSTLAGVRRVLDSAGIEALSLTAVVLIGGSSRIPLVSRMLTKSLGRPVLVDEHPQHCVALGAAAIAGGTSTVTDGARRITPGAPPITDSIPTIAAAAAMVAAAKSAKSAESAKSAKSAESRAAKKAAGNKPGKNRAAGNKSLASKTAAGKATTGKPSRKSAASDPATNQPDVTAALASAGSASKSAFTPLSSVPAFNPSSANPSFTPSAANPAFTPSSANPSFTPSSAKPAFAPSSANPASGSSPFSDEMIAATFPGTRSVALDVTAPILSRRAGGHRMPRIADWRRWVGAERYGVEVQPWRVVVATTVTVLLIAGGAYAFAPLGSDSTSDASTQVVDSPYVTPVASLPITDSPTPIATPTESPTASVTSAPARTKAPVATTPPKRRQSSTQPGNPSGSEPVGFLVGLAGRCLDVNEGSDDNGTQVQIFGCNGSSAQVWTVSKDGTLRALDKCLEVLDTDAENSRLVIDRCTGRGDQQWAVANGVVFNRASQKCLDVEGTNPNDRTPAITDACDGGSGQSWSLRPRNRS